MRNTVTGIVNVFRDGSHRETLSATLKVGGVKYEYNKAPKVWTELTYGNGSNLFEVCVTINGDGSNPRNTKLIKYL